MLKKLGRRESISHLPEYKSWTSMKARCLNPQIPNYENYGGRGITVCEEWLDNPYQFIKDMGEKPEPKANYSLDRIDNAKGYYKDNCKWSTKKEQANNRRSNKLITYDGRTQNISQWAKELGVKRITLTMRLKRGWSIEKAFTTPLGPQSYPVK